MIAEASFIYFDKCSSSSLLQFLSETTRHGRQIALGRQFNLRAEDDVVVGAGGAGEGAAPVVERVAVGLRALALEVERVAAGLALAGAPVPPSAAVLVGVERGARALAPHRAAAAAARRLHRQLPRARRVDVGGAGHRPRAATSAVRHDLERHVEAVDVADVEEVLAAAGAAAERELGQRAGHLAAGAVALEPPAAVAGRARQGARRRGTRGAAVAGPDAAGPGARDAPVLGSAAGLELEAGGREARLAWVRLHARVDRLPAFVDERERCCHCG